jgi:SNF2 family DNA or RNA helicase
MGLVAGNVVRWVAGANGGVGIVVDVDGGRQVRVRFDTGEENLFAWPNDVLERVRFEPGSKVHLLADDEIGVVSDVTEIEGRLFYAVQLPAGVQKTVLEDGVRAAVITDPLELLRAGTVDSARSVNLRLSATRLLFAHQFDELSSLSNSRVEIKPHQVGVLHRVMTSYPHRFLLADEVGLGKTIEAGLIIKELKARGLANRVLVLAPSGIVSQWQFELKTKFNEIFAHLNGQSVAYLRANHPGDNVWALNENVIASTTYASWDDRRAREIALVDWDLVIVDEAHHARRTLNNLAGTRLFRLVQELANPEQARSRAMLFLTATPMQLHPFELYSLIELLDPTLFPSYEDFDQHRTELAGLNQTVDAVRRWPALSQPRKVATADEVTTWLAGPRTQVLSRLEHPENRDAISEELLAKHRLSEALIRNRKAVVGGFMPRAAAVWEVDLTDAEWEAYHAVTSYAREGFERARAEKNNALGFLMATFQKLSCSSSEALRKSLLRRINKLEANLAPTTSAPADEEELEELSVSEALDDVLAARFRANTEEEIAEIRTIVSLLERIELDSKTSVLNERLAEILRDGGSPKVLIFTTYRDTQAYLAEHIPAPWTVNLFHGQLKPAEKDQAVARFRENEGPQILISTEAGGEGRNFQFCHMLVNYDLPWNPMKVEQRIGRLDRIGQKSAVAIFNLSTTGTIEERVLEVLTDRIGLFEQTVGGLDPILGDVERDLKRILALADERAEEALAEYERRLETRVSDARAAERRLADLIMDTRSFRQDEVQRLLDRKGVLSNDDLKAFALGAMNELGVLIERHPAIDHVFELRLCGKFADEFPTLVRDANVRVVTFDPATALEHEEVEFLAFGNELVDSLVEFVRRREYPGRVSHRRIRTNDVEPRSGWFFAYALEFEGVMRSKEIFPVFIASDGTPEPDLAAWLLERATKVRREEWRDPAVLPARDSSFDRAVSTAEASALQRLIARQTELADANRERLDQERTKLERFYAYKERAAAERLASVQSVYDRLLISDDADDQKILPVWSKNLENAERLVANLAEERDRRIGDLAGREQVAVQNELLAASFVEIEADRSEAYRETGLVLREDLLDRLLGLCRDTSAAEVLELRAAVIERGDQLAKLSEQARFDSGPGVAIARRLADALAQPDSLDAPSRALLRAAAEYFLLVDDEQHDLTASDGFADDQEVVNAVLHAIGSRTPPTSDLGPAPA